MIKNELKFLLTHSSIYGLGTVISQAVGFLLLPLYTHYLTTADYGVLETIDISNAIIGIVVTAGIALAMSRFYYVSNEIKERNCVVSTTYVSYVILVIITLPVLFLASPVLSKLLFQKIEYSYYFKISFISLVLGGLLDIGLMYLRLMKKSKIFIGVTITRLVFLIIFNIIFVVYKDLGVIGILYSTLFVRTVYSLFITAIILKKIRLKFSKTIAKNLIYYGLPIIPSKIANLVVKQSDKYFILYFVSLADMGIYSLALKLGNAIHSLITIPFNLAYVPRRFEIIKRNDAKETYSKIFTYYIFLVTFVGLFLSMFIPEILKVMVKGDFYKAEKYVPLVVLSMIIYGTHQHLDFGILYSKKTKYIALINMICAVTSIVMNYFLIRYYKSYGAIVSSILSLGLQAVLLYHFSKRFYIIKYQFTRIVSYLIIIAGIYFASLSICANIKSIYMVVFIKLMLFMSTPFIILLTNIITPDEKKELISIYNTRIKRKIAFKNY